MMAVPGLLCSRKFHPDRPQVDGGQDCQRGLGCCKVYHSPASKGLMTPETDALLPRLCWLSSFKMGCGVEEVY